MSEPAHRIRLREPWTATERPDELLLYRRFGKPSNLRDGETVWLMFPEAVELRRLTVNGREMPLDLRSWDVTAWLEERNQIEVTMGIGEDRTAITTGVALEIRG